jgi:hypothetical protein
MVKKKIPEAVKFAVWCDFCGKNTASIKCPVCSIEILYQRNFEAGHIQSEAKGGETKLGNLIPLCSKCNKSIGTKNVVEFMDEYNFKGTKALHSYIKKYYGKKEDNVPCFLIRLFKKTDRMDIDGPKYPDDILLRLRTQLIFRDKSLCKYVYTSGKHKNTLCNKKALPYSYVCSEHISRKTYRPCLVLVGSIICGVRISISQRACTKHLHCSIF